MKACIIGAGNVATHIALALYENNVVIDTVFNRTKESASALAGKVDARYISDINDLPNDSDIYIISISDEAVEEVASQIEWGTRLLVHTSGTLSINSIKKYAKNSGVLYPLQTFSKEKSIQFNNIPCFIEGSSRVNQDKIKKIASRLTQSVFLADSEERKKIHIAAVFSCNFTNYFFSISEKILESCNYPFEVLKPLIAETVEKSYMLSPSRSQTGPAIRRDSNIIEMHLDYLKNFPQWREIYKLISREIMQLDTNEEF